MRILFAFLLLINALVAYLNFESSSIIGVMFASFGTGYASAMLAWNITFGGNKK